ncbi:hypothetical protein [Pseudofulvibacter geojedonensis]|uniref:Uncharacterized protein n=1 Tax=Pseudofulvibacter geojedonensis TaxID=1123758 RepID=A0ABW3I0I7_9FLAO
MFKKIVFIAVAFFISKQSGAQNDQEVQSSEVENQIQDQVITDDLIVQGSIAVGTGSTNGENFGFDTMRFKEDNLRIHFDDTSTSASFPSNDWRITINDSGNGGSNYFSIDDATATTVPFKLEAGSGNNAIYVKSGGNVGLGTSNPALQLQVTDGNTPGLRLEQNGSNGWTPQTWDLAGNEANFFIRDVTNGSKLPLRIKPGAPTNTLFLAASGSVGIEKNNPDSNASLQLGSTSKGFLMNKLNTSQATTLAGNLGTGHEGMLIYNTDLKGYYSWTGSEWKALAFVESGANSVPELLNYQSVVRAANGNVLANQAVNFKMDIHQGSSTGTLVYSESHNVTTSSLGMVNFKIGSGSVLSGTFSAVDWGAGNHYLKVHIDVTGGDTFTEMGTTQFVSVPYALRAKYAENMVSTAAASSKEKDMKNKISKLEAEVKQLKSLVENLLKK